MPDSPAPDPVAIGYRRISLVFSHSWPGEMYLRFESQPGVAVMVGVTGTDLDELRGLLGKEDLDA